MDTGTGTGTGTETSASKDSGARVIPAALAPVCSAAATAEK
ncbi:hypothetical protein [Streptomyces sp. SJL17-4]